MHVAIYLADEILTIAKYIQLLRATAVTHLTARSTFNFIKHHHKLMEKYMLIRCVLRQHEAIDLNSLGQLWAWKGKCMYQGCGQKIVFTEANYDHELILKKFHKPKSCRIKVATHCWKLYSTLK